MSVPHTCPRCEGEKKIPDSRTGDYKTCPTCDGAGVVWEGAGPQEAAVGGEDPRQITGL